MKYAFTSLLLFMLFPIYLQAEESAGLTIDPLFSDKDSRITRSDLDPTFIMDDNVRQKTSHDQIQKKRKEEKLERKLKKTAEKAKKVKD